MLKIAAMPSSTEISGYEVERNKPMPSLNHGLIQANLIFALKLGYKDKYSVVSELSLDLSGWESVPDICIIPKMSLNPRQDVVTVKEPPLCAIEIISPSQSVNELIAKAERYFQYGVKSCWIAIPALQNIYVFSSPDDYEMYKASETLSDPVLDIELALKEVFS